MALSIKAARQLLGIGGSASAAQINVAFRRKALEHHPDRGGDPELFMQVQTAAQVLQREHRFMRREATEWGPAAARRREIRRRRQEAEDRADVATSREQQPSHDRDARWWEQHLASEARSEREAEAQRQRQYWEEARHWEERRRWSAESEPQADTSPEVQVPMNERGGKEA